MNVFHTPHFRWGSLAMLVGYLSLTSCSSFNTYQYLPRERQKDPIEQKYHEDRAEEIEDKAVEIASKDYCPRAKFSRLPTQPAVPIKELEQINPRDKDALIALQSQYIAKLHKYTMDVKRIVEKDRKDHLQACDNAARERVAQQMGR